MLCSLKCAAFLAIFSLWGFVFMLAVGALFQNESVGLLEDLPPLPKLAANATWADRRAAIRSLYKGNARNCFTAAGAYGGLFLVAAANVFWELRRNNPRTT